MDNVDDPSTHGVAWYRGCRQKPAFVCAGRVLIEEDRIRRPRVAYICSDRRRSVSIVVVDTDGDGYDERQTVPL